ncbi:MAG TPA: DNA-3-methyladenine glycosylase [Actinomycetota bacterium]|nr:DNA-3-methyladenine glycosylase [Actinomycetota bacterium]
MRARKEAPGPRTPPPRSPAPTPLPPVLGRDFYERDVTEVARDLLGCYLVTGSGRALTGGRIVETEAYGGPGDPGSHADRAPSGRARIMFGPAGIAYVYFTYGVHFCINAVTGPEGVGSAVLLRALEPMWGVRRMREAGAPASLQDAKLASGPGRLCRALGVGRDDNGADLTTGRIRILSRDGAPPETIAGIRVGLTLDDRRPWRFWTPSPAVSRGPVR